LSRQGIAKENATTKPEQEGEVQSDQTSTRFMINLHRPSLDLSTISPISDKNQIPDLRNITL